MGFKDLPRGWAERPITDPDVFADVVDLVVTEQSRRAGAVYLLLTHPDGRMLQPLAIRDVPAGAPRGEDARRWRTLLGDLAEHGTGSLVVVLARPGTPERTPDDDAALRMLGGAADGAGIELQGRAIATPSGILTLGPPGTGELSRPA
ncbi:MAG: hypothetical protein ACTHJJ_02805 [Intrasporangium sp.]|uniref:hypothetical protein n=1 Tax=Intrasporangium sp. TaxID=1925024 RepID=UPI003F7E64E7